MAQESLIVYGATCVWWDDIENAVTLPSGLPCCPHCNGVLFQVSREKWEDGVERFTKEKNDPQYPFLTAFMKGKCFKSMTLARKAFEDER